MQGYVRRKYQEIVLCIGKPQRFIQVLAGPRQVGKTTLVRQVIPTSVPSWERKE